MFNFFDVDIIPFILNKFKVKKVILTDLYDGKIYEEILNHADNADLSIISINSNKNIESDYNDIALNILPELNDYEAIFINDDPNWYTIFNELNIIKKNNGEFPLVFICNNIFPHKKRDSYKNPDLIPNEFINEFSRQLFLNNNIKIQDNFYHAIKENTPKNGVLTAIDDFLASNKSIGIMDIKFIEGITILYQKNNISKIRLDALKEEIGNYSLKDDKLSDSIIENQLLSNYISKFDISDKDKKLLDEIKLELNEKDKIINDFEDKVKFHDDELSFKDSQILDVNSELSLKESQIKNYESKLANREIEINNLNSEIQNVNDEINTLKSQLNKKDEDFKNKEQLLVNQISSVNSEIDDLKEDINNKEKIGFELNNKVKILNARLNEKNYRFERNYTKQLSQLEKNEYCISCFKEEINNNHMEIQYFKNESFTKKILSPFSYIYLVFKSKPGELSINYKLYKAIKNSKCFDIGFYLNNNKDMQNSNWCKYFSPELHYVCKGFNEERKFNKKYFNRNSKEELLDYIYKCEK